MKRLPLAAALAALTAVVAASLATAAAPTNGRLIVSNPAVNVGSNANTTLTTIQAPGTFRTTVYVPAGYRAPGGFGATGNNVGTAQVFVTKADGSRVTLNGSLTYVDPTRYSGDASCASSTATHEAIWILAAKQTNGTLQAQFPIFVDSQDTNSKLPASASYSLQWCAGSTGLNVTEVDLNLVKMLVNPEARGMYVWSALYEPAASGGKTAQAGQGVLTAAAVPIDAQVTLTSHRLAGSRLVTIAGRVSVVDQPLAGVQVQIFAGHSRRLALNKPRATVRTGADGSYKVTLRLGRGAWYARAKAATPYQVLASPTDACSSAPGTSFAAKGCVDATLAPFVVTSAPIARVL